MARVFPHFGKALSAWQSFRGLVPATLPAGGLRPAGARHQSLLASPSPSQYQGALQPSVPRAAWDSAPWCSAVRLASTKAPRDPERPKLPLSPWLRFLAHYRQQHPGEKAAMQAAAVQWKGVAEAQRSPWNGPYEAEKKVYDKAFGEYTDSGKLAAWKRDPEKPKRPVTAFLEFAHVVRAKHPQLKLTEASTVAGTAWKTLTDQEKAPYERRYAAEQARYTVAMEAYKTSGKAAAWEARKGPAAEAAGKPKPKAAAKRASAKAAGPAKPAAKAKALGPQATKMEGKKA